MSINIGPPSVEELRPRITVIGVGGAGGNAIANMIEGDIEGVDFIVANTDAQALNSSIAEHRIQLGPDITQGLGAGSRPEVGRAAAEETVEEVERALEGVNMVFIAAGMGGGTGTGAAPVIAQIARNKGILTVGVVTKPFLFEGTRRMRAAEAGIEELQKNVDTLIVIPNQNLFLVAKAETTFKEAFQLADEVLQQGVRSITDLMVMPGLINLDFADVRSVMNEMGKAMMGTGEGEGDNRALEAAERAIANPLLDGVSMQGAKGVIISIIGGEDMKLLEVDEAANHIRELVDPEANIIWGSAFNPDLEGRIRVSVVATGIEQGEATSPAPNRQTGLSANARGPKKPVLPPPTQEELEEDVDAARPRGTEFAQPARFDDDDEQDGPLGTDFGAPREQTPLDSGSFDARVPVSYDSTAFEEEEGDEYTEEDGFADAAEDDAVGSEGDDGYASLTGARISRGDASEDEDQEDDDGEDPWARIRESSASENEDGDAYSTASGEELELTNEAAAGEAEPQPANAPQDELLLDASRLAAADEEVQPAGGRRRRMFGGGTRDEQEGQPTPSAEQAPPPAPVAQQPAPEPRRAPAPGPASGSTLFERMANLSRANSSPAEDEEDDDEGGSSLRIPRFLGRQNNQ